MSTSRINLKFKLEKKTNSVEENRALEILDIYAGSIDEKLDPELVVQGYYSPRVFTSTLYNGQIKPKFSEKDNDDIPEFKIPALKK